MKRMVGLLAACCVTGGTAFAQETPAPLETQDEPVAYSPASLQFPTPDPERHPDPLRADEMAAMEHPDSSDVEPEANAAAPLSTGDASDATPVDVHKPQISPDQNADLSGEVHEPARDFFEEMLFAVVRADAASLTALFEEGADPDQEMPIPAPDWLREMYVDTPMAYYLENEPGLTLLMLAAYQGRPEVVQAFVDAGAEIFRKTRKHKSFALQFAAKSQSVEAMQRLLRVEPESETARMEIKLDLEAQRGSLWLDKKCIGVTRISTGRKGYETETGRFVVTNKYRRWTSTIYNARMPYFMRLSCGDFGLHAGEVPDYPASHGCIRLPEMDAKDFFKRVPIGTLVTIY